MQGATAVLVRDAAVDSSAGIVTSTGRALVSWPADARPERAVARAARDTIGGVLADSSLVVAAFERRWTFPADSIRGAEVVARWIDGEPAAIEWRSGAGCVRSVAVPVSPAGDLVIRDDFVRLVGKLSGGCSASRAPRLVDPQALSMLEGTGGLAPRDAFLPRGDVRSSIARWLLALALIAAVAELFVRRKRNEAIGVARNVSPEKRAA
jgi:hypothetical protein